MTVSKLATPHMFQNFGAKRWWDGRSQKITTIVVHHAATTNFDAMPGVWATREASAHYGIGQNGEIRAYVDEENTAWHCGNGNSYSIGIECTNTSGDPNWGVSNATVDALVRLIQEIQSRRGALQIVGHRDVPGNSTACPGPSLYPRLQEIRNRVNSINNTTNNTNQAKPEQKEEENEMFLFYKIKGSDAIYFFNGMTMTITSLNHGDEKNALNDVYKACNGGKDIPYREYDSKKDPWYARLQAVCTRTWQQNDVVKGSIKHK